MLAWIASVSGSAYAAVVGVDSIINSTTVNAYNGGDLSNTTALGPGWGSGYEIAVSFEDYIEFTLGSSLIDGAGWDIQFLEFDTLGTRVDEAAAVWLHEANSGTWYNVGTDFAADGILEGNGIWENPRGSTVGGTQDIDGYYVRGGLDEGKVDIATFFDIGGIYASAIAGDDLTLATLEFDSIILTGVLFAGDIYEFDGVQARYHVTSAVPVPAAVWLFGSGLMGLIAAGRRRRV